MTLAALLLAAQVAAAPAAPASAPAPGLFADFQSFCVAHRGDRAAPIAAAEALGFVPVPDAMLTALPANLTGVQARAKLTAGGAEFVFTGQGDVPAQGSGAPTRANMCFTGAQGADYAAVSAQAAAFATVPAYQSGAEQTVYAFAETAAGRRPLDPKDEAALRAAVKTGAATVLVVRAISGGALLAYAVPTS